MQLQLGFLLVQISDLQLKWRLLSFERFLGQEATIPADIRPETAPTPPAPTQKIQF